MPNLGMNPYLLNDGRTLYQVRHHEFLLMITVHALLIVIRHVFNIPTFLTCLSRHFSQKCGLVQIKELNKVRIIIPTCGMCAQAIANQLSPNANTQVDSIPSDGFCQSGA
ncbi:hypothetical protein DPMN_054586 [Dreissena polymorpha]|uniref:Uncharacterized protein n=1 Tax=Dreissena polymorpha TaxID=45954 RepID=A0A9D4CP64_DREPO|nr:hypothetical protein DPMN_054586 [Dreissena polymorpha]